MNIKKLERPGKKPWQLDLGMIDGKRQRMFFAKQDQAKAQMRARLDVLEKQGTDALQLPTPKRLDYLEAERRLSPLGATILQAVEFFEQNHKRIQKTTMTAAVAACKESKSGSGKRHKYALKIASHLDRFLEGREQHPPSAITPAEVEAWARRKRKDGKGVSLWTVRSRLIDVRTFFSFCIKKQWCLENPVARIEPIHLEDKPPGIHTVPEVEALLKACLGSNEGRECLPYAVLCYFGGLRPAEALQLTREDIGADLIDVSGHKAKTRRRRLIPVNETLAAWLAVAPGEPKPQNFFRKFERVRTAARVPWPHDVLRHSFCSYALPKYGATKTAEWAGHSEAILFAHYRERVKPQDADKFWALRP